MPAGPLVRRSTVYTYLFSATLLFLLTQQQCSVARRLTNQVGPLYTIVHVNKEFEQMVLFAEWLAGMSDQTST